MCAMPRPEYPRPQFARENWQNLNGFWEFEQDPGASGRERGMVDRKEPYSSRILVPFCPESVLSGIGCTDFMPAVWYRRTFDLPGEALEGRVLLHFGAVDHDCEVWINGQSVGTHRGGYTPFVFDITKQVRAGDNTVTVFAQDDTRSPLTPSGKQSTRYHSAGCHYTRTTGI